MKVTKCDRCGAEMYTNGDYTVKVTDNNFLLSDSTAKVFDLCSDCAHTLISDFMKGVFNDD